MKKQILAAAMGVALMGSAVANAALVLDGGVAGQIGDFGAPGKDVKEDNDVVLNLLGNGVLLNGMFGANVKSTSKSNLEVVYLGKEAGFKNYFTISNTSGSESCGFNTLMAPGASCLLSGIEADTFLNFRFDVDAFPIDGSIDRSVTNGANNSHLLPKTADFWAGWVDGWLWIALDDGGGLPDDDNHDDMVIKIRAVPVPEPSSLALIGMGLVGAGLAARKRAKA